MPAHGADIVKRFKEALKRIEPFQHTLEEVFRFCLPQRDIFHTTSGDKKGNVVDSRGLLVFDATAPIAYMDLAGDYQLGLTPPNEDWVKQGLEPGVITRLDLSPDDVLRVEAQLEAQTDEIFRFIRQSNFDTEIHEAFLDMVASTGALLVNEGDDLDPLVFKAVPINEFIPEEGPHGVVETVFREHLVPGRSLTRLWPDAEWTGDTQRNVEDSPDEKVKILEATIFNPETQEYDYVVIEMKVDHVALEDTFKVTPWVVFRSNVVPGEVLGRGPGVMALPDIRTLNEMARLILENATWAIVGAYQTDDYGVVNVDSIDLDAGIIIPIEPGSQGIRPIERSGDFRISQEMVADLRITVKGYFLRAELPPVDAPVRTATEIGTRAQIALNRIGPPTARVYSELIRPLWRRIRDILLRKNQIQPIEGVGERDIRVVPISPFAQASEQAQAFRAFNAMVTLAGMDPEGVARIVDLAGFERKFLLDSGFPPSLLRTEEQEAQVGQAQAAEEAAQTVVDSGALTQAGG